MHWPDITSSQSDSTRRCWGYTFQWTPQHWSAEDLHPLKYSYDRLAEECLERLDTISPAERPQLQEQANRTSDGSVKNEGTEASKTSKRDLFALLEDHAPSDELLNKLWTEVNTVPEWVNWDQIARGQEVFYRYGGPALTGLAYQSLLGGMGSARVVETLARTGGFSTKVARRRMFETTQFILECTNSLDSIKPGGVGHASSIRVRFLHAAVRRRIMRLAKQRPTYYNVEEWGVPISDLDSIGTISTFSGTLIWVSFPRQGIWLRQQEAEDFTALWRLVAHYMGAPTDPFANAGKHRAMMESLMLHEIRPSETSKILANNVVESLSNQPPSYPSRDFHCAEARWLNGNELIDCLGLEKPSLWYSALVCGQCIFFMVMCYTYRSIPSWDRRKNERLKRLFYNIIVGRKFGLGEASLFEFQYVPSFDISTDKARSHKGAYKSSVERRNLMALILAFGGVVAFIGTVFCIVPSIYQLALRSV